MAATVIRTTYALDAATVAALDRLAQQWNLSRSAALRKLVHDADQPNLAQREAAWQRLCGSLSAKDAAAWRRQVRHERAATDARVRRRS